MKKKLRRIISVPFWILGALFYYMASSISGTGFKIEFDEKWDIL
jgi:hypothetical protein